MSKQRIQSPSSINTYRQCPRQYFYKYVLDLPTKPNIHSTRGKIAHQVLEDFFEIDTSNINMKNYEEKLRNKMQQLLLQEWEKNKNEIDNYNLTEDKKKFYFSETMMMVLNWLDKFIEKIKGFENLSFDEIFEKLKPLREEKYKSNNLYVRGFIDAIKEEEGQTQLIDYKTSKKMKIRDDYRIQLGIYSLLYEEEHGNPPDKAGINFLRHRIKTVPVTDELLEEAQENIDKVHKETQSTNIEDYPMNPSPLCKWCDFEKICYEDQTVEEYKKESEE